MDLVVALLGREENRVERRDSLLPSLLEWTDRGFLGNGTHCRH